jgi:uncharacterized protein (DUF2235 family)
MAACILIFCDRNFEKVIKAAYRWLCVEYQEGDRIFLFGEQLCVFGVVDIS